MAAQGKPKLYARQKAKHLTLILLASLLLSVYVQAEVVLYCQTELATGISKDKQTGRWKTGSFILERHTIKFDDDYTSVTGLWLNQPFRCAPGYSTYPHQIVCLSKNGLTFIYDKSTRRFLYSRVSTSSYTENEPNADTAGLEAGTCQKF